jgi:iron complex outermembrane recepter protein
MKYSAKKFFLTTSLVALGAALPFASAFAQQAADTGGEIIVTGTSIRGTAPVGSNLIAVGQEELKAANAQTIQQALANVPALTSFGNVAQGQVANSFYQPTIHSLGASASNSTLVLIDGHRPATGGTNHSHADPNVIPINMVERVEVLADGSSSVYGSDAVAGVVNFITRKRFDGVQLDATGTHTDGGDGYSFGFLSGKTWDTGGAIFAYSYSLQPMLMNKDRPYTYPDQRSRGGTNFLSFNCGQATLQPGGAGVIYTSATSGVSVANSAANSLCTSWGATSRVDRDVRNNAMLKISQQVTEDLTLNAEMLYGSRRTDGLVSAGTITATAFQTGAQANPFYVRPAGYTGAATNETIRWDATDLFGPARSFDKSDNMYASITANYKLGDNFELDALLIAGRDDSTGNEVKGNINASVATLALNGTTNSGGNTTTESVPGTGLAILKLPLTTANALDVWNPVATNRTSAAVREALLDNYGYRQIIETFQQARLIANGTLFSVPAGEVKIAVGAELFKTQWDNHLRRPNNTGPASLGTSTMDFRFYRDVTSVFGEVGLPLIDEDMAVPMVKAFSVNASVRHDNYSDFGETTNPKVAFNWDVVTGLRLRGNVSTSFVAPGLDITGNDKGLYLNASWGSTTNNLAVPVAAYPNIVNVGIPGCTTASVTCNISSLQGIQTNKGDTHATAQTGKGWSLGFDYAPTYLQGFRSQVTYWNTQFEGAITGPNIGNAVNAVAMQKLLTFYPGGASAAQIAKDTAGLPQTSPVPAVVSYIYNRFNSNWINLYVSGIDASFDYTYETSSMGDFVTGLSVSHFTKFDQSFGDAPIYSILNTSGHSGSYPSIATQGRFRLGWSGGGASVNVYTNYIGSYRNWGASPVNPITSDANGNPGGGGDNVRASVTYDLNIGYGFQNEGMLKDVDVSLAVRNVTDKEPPFYNGSIGYDVFSGNPTGRYFQARLSKRF